MPKSRQGGAPPVAIVHNQTDKPGAQSLKAWDGQKASSGVNQVAQLFQVVLFCLGCIGLFGYQL